MKDITLEFEAPYFQETEEEIDCGGNEIIIGEITSSFNVGGLPMGQVIAWTRNGEPGDFSLSIFGDWEDDLIDYFPPLEDYGDLETTQKATIDILRNPKSEHYKPLWDSIAHIVTENQEEYLKRNDQKNADLCATILKKLKQ